MVFIRFFFCCVINPPGFKKNYPPQTGLGKIPAWIWIVHARNLDGVGWSWCFSLMQKRRSVARVVLQWISVYLMFVSNHKPSSRKSTTNTTCNRDIQGQYICPLSFPFRAWVHPDTPEASPGNETPLQFDATLPCGHKKTPSPNSVNYIKS